MSIQLQGKVQTFDKGEHSRRYVVVVLTFKQIRDAFYCEPFSAINKKGEQRGAIPAQVTVLRKAISKHDFTPTCMAAGMRTHHHNQMKIDAEGNFSIEITRENRLPLTDGQQRKLACEELIRKGNDDVLNLTFPVVIHIDGNTQRDFVNLQKGRSVDPTHIRAMSLLNSLPEETKHPDEVVAMEVAMKMYRTPDGAFQKMIRFDSNSKAILPFTAISARGSSDLANSLCGMSRIASKAGKTPMSSDWMVDIFNRAFGAIQKHAPELLNPSQYLTPPPDGTTGSCTLLIGIANLLAYRVLSNGNTTPTETDLSNLAVACREALSSQESHDFSAQGKRRIIGSLARSYSESTSCELHDGIPLGLARILSGGAFGCSPVPKPAKAPKVVKPKSAPRNKKVPQKVLEAEAARATKVIPSIPFNAILMS